MRARWEGTAQGGLVTRDGRARGRSPPSLGRASRTPQGCVCRRVLVKPAIPWAQSFPAGARDTSAARVGKGSLGRQGVGGRCEGEVGDLCGRLSQSFQFEAMKFFSHKQIPLQGSEK